MTVVFPGSFDPVTYGHLDIIERAETLFGKVVVVLLHNARKKHLFTVEERKKQLHETTKHINGVQLETFDGLLIDFVKQHDIKLIIRGIRSITDYEYELPVAIGIKQLCGDVETVFIPTSPKYAYISSSMVKEVASYNTDVTQLVPEFIQSALIKKYSL